jgi:two-component system, OmpR family, sensor histidine kinase KdpD
MTESPSNLPSRPLILAWVENHPKSVILLHAARKRAREMGAKWRVIYVETPSHAVSVDGAHEHMLRLLTLAMQMGGEVVHLEADNVEEGFRRLLESEKDPITLCMVGAEEAEGGWRAWRSSSWQRIAHLAREYTEVETVPLVGQPFVRKWFTPKLPEVRPQQLAYALLSVGVAFAFSALLQGWRPQEINSQNIALIFMIACAFAASRFGLIPGLLASVTGFVAVNYFFTTPHFTVRVADVADLLNMGLFLGAAVLISLFNSQTRAYAERAARRELGTQALFALYRITANAFTRQQALEKLQRRLSHMLHMEVAFFLPPLLSPDRIEPTFPADLVLDQSDREALETCWREVKATGLASPFNPDSSWRFEPMLAPGGEIGVLGVRLRKDQRLDPWYGGLLAAVADQTATLLEHIELERSMEATRLREERERLRSKLLSSVSHDLKTPLSGIIGALSVHQSLGARLPPERRTDLLETALEEAYRLDSFITNILDMTRLESGKIEFRQEWHDVPSLIHQVSKRLEHRLRRHVLIVQPFPSGVEVFMDVMMTEQVLQNVLDNACKYTPAGTRIELGFRADEQGFFIEVRDRGRGLPADKLQQVFDKYARLQKEDTQVAGTGLGLSICKAIMEAQGGSITATNHPDGGAVFILFLPKWRKLAQTKHVA